VKTSRNRLRLVEYRLVLCYTETGELEEDWVGIPK
jgi:hypothetical protein